MIEILNFFPKNISDILEHKLEKNFEELEEIRIRVDKPIILKTNNAEIIIPYKMTRRRNIKNLATNL